MWEVYTVRKLETGIRGDAEESKRREKGKKEGKEVLKVFG